MLFRKPHRGRRAALRGKMDFEASAEQLHFVSLAQRLAKESLGPRAEHYDEAGVHPTESWHDLWQNGLLATAVPREYGGSGLDMLTYCMVMEKLAEGCTSTAMTAPCTPGG